MITSIAAASLIFDGNAPAKHYNISTLSLKQMKKVNDVKKWNPFSLTLNLKITIQVLLKVVTALFEPLCLTKQLKQLLWCSKKCQKET